MKPILLTMHAFGPFTAEQVIDFRLLGEKRLFLIAGPTGAGKTTIFDAISFALYGVANGDVRETENFRSHFANGDEIAKVSLHFEMKDRKYIIERIPKQIRRKSKGDGLTEQKPSAELSIYASCEENAPLIRTLTKIKDIDDEIQNILGLDARQFRQIMMIPQGEFRELLLADSNDREKILRQLFRTELYERLQKKLEDEAKTLYEKIEKAEAQERALILRIEQLKEVEYVSIDCVIEELEVMKTQDQALLHELWISIDTLDKKQRKLVEQRLNAITMNERLNQLHSTKKALEIELALEVDINKERAYIKKCRDARQIKPYEENYLIKKSQCSKKEEEIKLGHEKLQELEKKYEQIKIQYDFLSSNEEDERRNQLLVALNQLQAYKGKVIKIDELAQAIKILERLSETEESQSKAVELKLKELDKKYQALKYEGQKRVESQEKADALKLKMNHLVEQGKRVRSMRGLVEKRDQEQSLFREIEKLEVTMHQRYMDEEQRVLQIKRDYFLSQAALLAIDIKDDVPCPVCGSLEHPNLAKHTGRLVNHEAVEREEVHLSHVRDELNKVKQSREASNQSLKHVMDQINSEIEEIDEVLFAKMNAPFTLIAIENLLFELLEQNKVWKIDLESLEQQAKEKKRIEDEMLEIEEEIPLHREQSQQYHDSLRSKREDLSRLKGQLELLCEEIPLTYRESEVLETTILIKDKALREQKKKYDETKNLFEQMNDELNTLRSRVATLATGLHELQEEVKINHEQFMSFVTKFGFNDVLDYEQASVDDEKLSSLEDKIKSYDEGIIKLKQRVHTLSEDTKNQLPVLIEELDQAIVSVKEELSLNQTKKGQLENRIDNNMKIKQELLHMETLIGSHKKAYSLIGKLSRVANGKNEKRLTLERYVLQAFLKDILYAANLRLQKMSGERYYLRHTEELLKYGKQSGLEIEVIDNYTGKARGVKTLSGGETFKASLSMALGLSDVVQSYSGGVRLDTMYIDEGFGTLDPESLDQAIESLIELQKSGRVVGIISHVPDLIERIDAKLWVEPSSTGSHAYFEVL